MIFENAHEILKKLKQKQFSAQEVLEYFLKQVEAVNPSINAVVALDAERALEKAKKADKKRDVVANTPLRKRLGASPSPLLAVTAVGIPWTPNRHALLSYPSCQWTSAESCRRTGFRQAAAT